MRGYVEIPRGGSRSELEVIVLEIVVYKLQTSSFLDVAKFNSL